MDLGTHDPEPLPAGLTHLRLSLRADFGRRALLRRQVWHDPIRASVAVQPQALDSCAISSGGWLARKGLCSCCVEQPNDVGQGLHNGVTLRQPPAVCALPSPRCKT